MDYNNGGHGIEYNEVLYSGIPCAPQNRMKHVYYCSLGEYVFPVRPRIQRNIWIRPAGNKRKWKKTYIHQKMASTDEIHTVHQEQTFRASASTSADTTRACTPNFITAIRSKPTNSVTKGPDGGTGFGKTSRCSVKK